MTVDQLLWGVVVLIIGQVAFVLTLFMYNISWLRSIDDKLGKMNERLYSLENRISNIERDLELDKRIDKKFSSTHSREKVHVQ